VQFASAAKQEMQAVQCPGSVEWSMDRNAGPGKDLEHAGAQRRQFTFSSFPVLFSRILAHLHASTFVHVHDHFDHSLTCMPSKSISSLHHTAFRRVRSPATLASLAQSLSVLLLVTICVCLEIALRTRCSRSGQPELMTDCTRHETRHSHAHRTRKSRPASPDYGTQSS